MESCGPGTEILVPILTFVHDGRGTSANVLLHPYLHDARSSSFTSSKQNLFYFTGDLASFWTTSLPFAVPHLQSLTTGLCLGTRQFTYFHRLSTNSLVALNSVCVIVSKIRPFLRVNEVLLGRFFFLTLDGFRTFSAVKTVSFRNFTHLFKRLSTVFCGNFVVITNDNYSPNKAHLLDF
jgi:hypothetical protein